MRCQRWLPLLQGNRLVDAIEEPFSPPASHLARYRLHGHVVVGGRGRRLIDF